ncbi:MAG: hypothetical protein JSS79_20130 [Bacteroidetes bacterium]|nr:hypothetical protein [Bacteroidota bacterium]
MTRALFLLLACLFALVGCNTQRTICPAYQSAFIFDKSAERKTFLVYNDDKNQPQEVLASNSKTLNLPPRDSSWDKSVVIPAPSLPIERRVKKDRYLLLPNKTYRKALRALQTVPMKAVYPKKVDDSLATKKALDSAARSVTDTITSVAADTSSSQPKGDSVYVITKEKEKFNVDQDNYMWYFRDILVLPDVKLAMEESKNEKSEAGAATSKTKQGFFQKLKGIFKKKPKAKSDSTQVVQEEVNPTDSTSTEKKPDVPKKKKGLGGLFGKKSKAPATAPKKPEGKKEEDDGF